MTGRERFRPVVLAALAAGLVMAVMAVMAGPAWAASVTVTTTTDEVNANGECSLREAIANANQDDVSGSVDCAPGSGHDTIAFSGSLSGTITLTAGELTVSDADGLTIEGGDDITISGNHASRVFSVAAGAQLALRDLTVVDGYALNENGGGIHNLGTVELDGSTVTGNLTYGFNVNGGGIYNVGTLTVTGSTISNNDADKGNGGGIYSDGTLTVTGSTLAGNRAVPYFRSLAGNIDIGGGAATVSDSTITWGLAVMGGGILNDGTLTISGSTLAANTAQDGGGGMQNNRTLTLTNSTISGNTASNGGGIRSGGTATVTNSTLTGNSAIQVGGILSSWGATLYNTIVADNPGGDCGEAIDGGNNLIEDGRCITAATSVSGDPSLGPLAVNGGQTETHALLDGSIAIGAGSNAFAAGLDFDQRGDGFARIVGGTVDIGAYEKQTIAVAVDIKPGTCPNPLSMSEGTYPVSIVGTPTFDVSQVDPASVRLEGVAAETGRQVTVKDVATPYAGTITDPPLAGQCTVAGPDGRSDLNLKFDAKQVLSALGPVTNKQVRVLTVTGNLTAAYGGTPFQGHDVVVINTKK